MRSGGDRAEPNLRSVQDGDRSQPFAKTQFWLAPLATSRILRILSQVAIATNHRTRHKIYVGSCHLNGDLIFAPTVPFIRNTHRCVTPRFAIVVCLRSCRLSNSSAKELPTGRYAA